MLTPLIDLYRWLYDGCAAWGGGYPPGLLWLAALTFAALAPLKRLAARVQDRERKIQAVLQPQLARIRRESADGAARHARTAALYRRYAYHPVYALRSALGLLLQLPFLYAAYVMLRDCEPLRGLAWGPIHDLGAPDGLLAGVNALPLLMTAVNVAALWTTPGFAGADRRRGLGVAALFLLLLYAAPSAMLVYWTVLNLFTLLGNGIHALASGRAAAGRAGEPCAP